MIREYAAIFEVFKYGKSVADPALWKNRQLAVNNFVALASAALVVACGFGYCYNIPEDTFRGLGEGIAAIFGILAVFNSGTTMATSEKVGYGKPRGIRG